MEIEKIYIYPVKGLRPFSVESAEIGPYGFVHDRTFMLLKVHRDPVTSEVARLENMHISHFHKMSLFTTSLEGDGGPDVLQPTKVLVTYTWPKFTPIEEARRNYENHQTSFPLRPDTAVLETIQIEMHSSATTAYDMGAAHNSWFSARLDHEVILAFVGSSSRAVLGNLAPNYPNSPRPSTKPSLYSRLSWMIPTFGSSTTTTTVITKTDPAESRIAFQDCAQFLIVTTASLAAVSERLPPNQPMDVTKFRPNIVLSSAPKASSSSSSSAALSSSSAADASAPWTEDFWSRLTINESITLHLTANCARCQSINVDYSTGALGADPAGSILKRLQKDRRVDPGMKYSPCFGRYAFRRPGAKQDLGKRVQVGMKVEVTGVNEERTKFEWPGISTT